MACAIFFFGGLEAKSVNNALCSQNHIFIFPAAAREVIGLLVVSYEDSVSSVYRFVKACSATLMLQRDLPHRMETSFLNPAYLLIQNPLHS